MDEKDQTDLLTELRKDVKEILQRLSKVEVKATLWGGLGGLVSAGILYIGILIKDVVGR